MKCPLVAVFVATNEQYERFVINVGGKLLSPSSDFCGCFSVGWIPYNLCLFTHTPHIQKAWNGFAFSDACWISSNQSTYLVSGLYQLPKIKISIVFCKWEEKIQKFKWSQRIDEWVIIFIRHIIKLISIGYYNYAHISYRIHSQQHQQCL